MTPFLRKVISGITLVFTAFTANAESERAITAWQWIEQGATIIDVRTPEEYANKHIDNAQNLPLQSISSHLITLDKSATYVVYCRSGNRSAQALQIMKKSGFNLVHNGGGISEMLSAKPNK
jgi:phage shock protein E